MKIQLPIYRHLKFTMFRCGRFVLPKQYKLFISSSIIYYFWY
nr:MAG TPA: hypothetical protein [Bacteriophage sp.]